MPNPSHESASTTETRQPWEAPALTVIDVSQQTQGADITFGAETFGYTPTS